jgi:hypothetical protein
MATDSLAKTKKIYNHISNSGFRQEDLVSASLIDRWGSEEAFNKMKSLHTNKGLESMLLKKLQFVVEWNHRWIRKTMPIYQVPKSSAGRAHLFAPVKQVGPFPVPTYWFNILIIWLSGLLLYATLVYDLLRRITNWNQVRKLRRES